MLLRALASVAGQSFTDFEIVLVDDGSSDGSLDAAEDYLSGRKLAFKSVRLAKNVGIPAARNAGLAAAGGAVAAFLDSDDAWHPHYLSIVKAAYAAAKPPLFVSTDYLSDGPSYAGPVKQFDPPRAPFDPIELMITRPFVHTMSCFSAPMAHLVAVGGFNERLPRFSDLDLYIRLLGSAESAARGPTHGAEHVHIPQIGVLKSIHLESRRLADYERDWEAGKTRFLETIFKYPFMRSRRVLREESAQALTKGQARFFENFRGGSPS